MIRISASVAIDRPPEEVFDYILDFENAPEWQTGVVKSKRVTEGPVRVGTRFEEDVRMVVRRVRTACVITDVEPGRSVSFVATSAPMDYQGQFVFDHTGKGTRVAVTATIEMKGLWRLLGPLVAMDARGGVRKELGRVKTALEGRAARRAVVSRA